MIIMACPDCKQQITEDSTKYCPATKDHLHWYVAFEEDKITDEYAWMRKFRQQKQRTLF